MNLLSLDTFIKLDSLILSNLILKDGTKRRYFDFILYASILRFIWYNHFFRPRADLLLMQAKAIIHKPQTR